MGRTTATTTRKRSRNGGGSSTTTSSGMLPRTTSLSELAAPAAGTVDSGAGGFTGSRRPSLIVEYCFPVVITETAEFLKVCGLCSRGLGPGRDTFIYMGEAAFCSHECRQQQMNLDELIMETKCSDQSGKATTTTIATA